MSYLRSLVKSALPSSLLFALHDFKYLDTPEDYSQKSKGINIARSHCYPRKTIYFLPDRPVPGFRRGSVSYKLCRLLGYRITYDSFRYERGPGHRYDVVFKYNRKETFPVPLSSSQFEVDHVINGDLTDLSKHAVNAAFEEVFGYAVGVDPTAYDGAIVAKSNVNAANDGHLVEGPIAPADIRYDQAYQRVIDNSAEDSSFVLDYQVPVHGDQIPLVYLKYRPVETRFLDESTYATVKEPAEVFSKDEIDKLLQFARHMKIDYGELDVLRDKGDRRIYVVDANSTPWGPPRGLEESDRQLALAKMTRSFERLIQTPDLRRHADGKSTEPDDAQRYGRVRMSLLPETQLRACSVHPTRDRVALRGTAFLG